MPNVVITTQGMEFITSAHNDGIFIDLRYFVPVYDDRIDGSIRTAQLSSFAQIADSSLVSPIGEIIWKQESSASYNLSNNTSFVISANAIVSNTVPNSYQSVRSYTNLLNGTPLSNQVSATGWTVSQNGISGDYTWSATSAVGIVGDNTQPAGLNGYFRRQDYYPVYDTSAQGNLRGSFKCVIDETVGNIKFNKIALYAVAVDASNSAVSNVKFFGEAYLGPTPAIRSTLGIGYDRFEWDIQIDISGVSANFEDIFFSSSADYWSHSPGGLYYPGKIGVGNFVDDQKEIQATAHLRKSRDTSGSIDLSSPILRLDYNTSAYVTVDVTNKGVFTNTNVAGDIVLRGPVGFDPYSDGIFALRPYEINAIALGTSAEPFTELWLFQEQDNTVVPDRALLNIHPYWDVGIRVWQGTYPFDNIGEDSEYQVEIGQGEQIRYSASRTHAIKINNYGILIESNNGNDDIDDLLYTSRGFLKGADIWRENQNLYIYSVIGESVESKDICFIAGFSTDALASFTHNDISDAINDNYLLDVRNQSEGYESLLERANIRMAALGRIGLYSSHIELRQLRYQAHGTALLTTEMQGDSYPEITRRLLIGSYLNGEELTPEIIGARVSAIDGSYLAGNIPGDALSFVDSEWLLDSGGATSNGSIYLITGKIWVDSHISPIANARWSLGFEGQWKSLFAKTIQIGISNDNLLNRFDSNGFNFSNYNSYSYFGGFRILESITQGLNAFKVIRKTSLLTNDAASGKLGDDDSYVSPNKSSFETDTVSLGTIAYPIHEAYFTSLRSTTGYFTQSVYSPSLTSTNIYFTGDTTNGAALSTYKQSLAITTEVRGGTGLLLGNITLQVTRVGDIVTLRIPYLDYSTNSKALYLYSNSWPSWIFPSSIIYTVGLLQVRLYKPIFIEINGTTDQIGFLRWISGGSPYSDSIFIDVLNRTPSINVNVTKIYPTSIVYHV